MDDGKKIILNKILEKKNDKPQNLFFENNVSDKELEEEGQLLVDIFKDGNNVVIKTIVAGVNSKDLDISLRDDIITIKGKRVSDKEISNDDYFCKECYWGKFSRSIILPFKVREDGLDATLKNGMLTIIIPRANVSSVNKIKIKELD